jgi:hypothetical protein
VATATNTPHIRPVSGVGLAFDDLSSHFKISVGNVGNKGLLGRSVVPNGTTKKGRGCRLGGGRPRCLEETFLRDEHPKLPPTCVNGKLKLVSGGLSGEPRYQSDLDYDHWDTYDTAKRWSAKLWCDETDCGEIVHLIGDSEAVESEVEISEGNSVWGVEELLRLQAVFPAPLFFRVSGSVPRAVKE